MNEELLRGRLSDVPDLQWFHREAAIVWCLGHGYSAISSHMSERLERGVTRDEAHGWVGRTARRVSVWYPEEFRAAAERDATLHELIRNRKSRGGGGTAPIGLTRAYESASGWDVRRLALAVNREDAGAAEIIAARRAFRNVSLRSGPVRAARLPLDEALREWANGLRTGRHAALD